MCITTECVPPPQFVLRGGLHMSAMCAEYKINRPASDIDLSCTNYPLNQVPQFIYEACEQEGEYEFEVRSVKQTWQETITPGYKFEISTSGYMFSVDVATMDPIVDALQPLPVSCGAAPILCASPETCFAWKLHSLFELKDYWLPRHLMDLYLFIVKFPPMDVDILIPAIKLAFESRGSTFLAMNRMLIGYMGTSNKSKKNWQLMLAELPPELASILPAKPYDAISVVNTYVKNLLGIQQQQKPIINILSFGYDIHKPIDNTDILVNVRHWPAVLKKLTAVDGLDPSVPATLFKNKAFVAQYNELLRAVRYAADNTLLETLIVSIGCENGRMRSVAIAEQLAADLGGVPVIHIGLKS